MKKLLLLTFSLASFIVFGQGKMLTLSGTAGDYVDLGNETKRNFGSAGNNFTVEFWFYDTDGTAELLGLDNGYLTFQLTSGDLVVTISDGTDTRTFTNAVSASAWHHVALVMDDESGNELKLWLDGSRTDSVVETTWNPDLSSGQWYLGALSTSPTTPASASFDELRFWSEARTKENLLWYRNDTISTDDDDTTALEGYFTFQTLASSTLVDAVSNGSNGSTSNATSPSVVKTTAPVPYYTVAVGSLFASSTWATGQGVPTIPSNYTKIWLQNSYTKLEAGDPEFTLGAVIMDYDTTGAGTDTRSRLLRRRHGASTYSGNVTYGDLVIRGAGHHIAGTVTVTRSITSQSRPGNCPACGNAELFIDASGRLNFTGTTIRYTSGVMNISGIADVKSSGHTLTLTNSEINIESGGLLLSEASGSNTWNMSGATMNIAYNGGISNTEHSTSPVTGSPTINFTTEISTSHDGWRHFSTPLTSGTLADFSDDLTVSFVSAATYNVYAWDASENGSSGKANGWTAITSTGTSVVDGFVIYEDNTNFPALAGGQIDMSGGFGSGDATYNIYNFFDPQAVEASQNKGWNYIPNPYPGAISLQKLINDYAGDGGSDPAEFPLAYQAVHVWDARNGQYKPILASGETLIVHDNSSGQTGSGTTVVSSDYVRPFQGFWVKMTDGDGATQFTLKNQHRYSFRMTLNSNEYHKSTYPKLRMNVFGPDSLTDQSLVVFNPQTTDGWDAGHEAFDIMTMNPGVPSMWIPSQEGNMSIVSTNLNTGADKTFPVVVTAGSAGQHYFDYVEGDYGQWWDLVLIDSTAQKTHDLTSGAYTYFESQAGDSRTLWITVSKSGVSVPEFAPTELYVTQSDGQWQVDIGEQAQTGQIQLMDISGRVIDVKEVNGQLTSFSRPDQAGVYLLRWMRENEAPLVAKMTTF